MTAKDAQIKYLFSPRGIAVIGASGKKGKIGYSIVDNIISNGYEGEVYPVNPKGGEILGRKAYASIGEIAGPVDLATITIPAKFVVKAVEECGKKGVKFLSIITSGFSEVGNLKEENEILALADKYGMRVLGPNIFGIYCAGARMNATFGPKDVTPGSVAIITQSGALGIAMIGKTQVEKIGLSAVVSVGDKSDIDEADLVEYLMEDESTKVILMYIEGIKKGRRLVSVLNRASALKPVIVIKSGRSARGALAAASHTGSLAGADEVFSDIMNQCGVHRATSIQEALNWAKYLSSAPAPQGENCVIITNGGGIGVLAADACELYDINLFDNQDTLKEAFSTSVPDFGSVKNPVDITGGATIADYKNSIGEAFKHPEIHSIICLGCETAMLNAQTFKEVFSEIHKKHGKDKTVVYSFFGGEALEQSIMDLKKEGVPIYTDVYEAISCLGEKYKNYRHQSHPATVGNTKDSVPVAEINTILEEVKKEGRNFLLAGEAREVMNLAGITIPKSKVAKTVKDAVQFADEIGYPVVLKVVSKDIIHKSDAGGIALDLQDKKEVLDAYQSILHSCKQYKSDAYITGIEVCEMVQPGLETIVGGRKDEVFGPIVMFGLGGIYVEVLKDISFRGLPTSKSEISKMIRSINTYPLLLGVRGEEQKDINGVVDVIYRISTMINQCELITDIELNPLIAYEEGDGIKAVDARILIQG